MWCMVLTLIVYEFSPQACRLFIIEVFTAHVVRSVSVPHMNVLTSLDTSFLLTSCLNLLQKLFKFTKLTFFFLEGEGD